MGLRFDRFPFFIGVLSGAGASDIPPYLPFALSVDARLALPRLEMEPVIADALDRAYTIGSLVSTPLGQSQLAQRRMAEMVADLDAAAGGVGGKRVLEIGCGYGDLLAQLRTRGAVVAGVEIGPQGREAERRFGFPVAAEPLRPDLFSERFDIIFSYGCLEHIAGIADLFDTAFDMLAPGGLFFHSVPNADQGFAALDPNFLLHEHVNYFSAASAERLLRCRGFAEVGSRPSAAGNELRFWGKRPEAPAARTWPGEDAGALAAERAALQAYAVRLRGSLDREIAAIRARLDRGERVGFYAGGFVIAALGEFGEAVQFFDGDDAKAGTRWLDGLAPIRPASDLPSAGLDCLVVFASHHFPAIARSLAESGLLPQGTRLLCHDDL